jgi:hypothetical protein
MNRAVFFAAFAYSDNISEALLKGVMNFVESEGFGVVLAEAGGIFGNGLIAEQGLLQGFYCRGIKGWSVLFHHQPMMHEQPALFLLEEHFPACW